jgi:hypothetical protein
MLGFKSYAKIEIASLYSQLVSLRNQLAEKDILIAAQKREIAALKNISDSQNKLIEMYRINTLCFAKKNSD